MDRVSESRQDISQSEPTRKSNFDTALEHAVDPNRRTIEAVAINGLEELKDFIPDPKRLALEMNRIWGADWHDQSQIRSKDGLIVHEITMLATQLKAFRELLDAKDDKVPEKISHSRAYLPEKILLFAERDPEFRTLLRGIFEYAFKGRPDWLEGLEAQAAKDPHMKWVSPRRFIGSVDKTK